MPSHKSTIVQELEMQSAQFMIAGFSFAAAFAWMEYMRYLTAYFLDMAMIEPNGGMQLFLSAVVMSVIAVLLFFIVRMFVNVKPFKFFQPSSSTKSRDF